MKKFFIGLTCASLLLIASVVNAAEFKAIDVIPGRYATLLVTDLDPSQPLDKAKLLESITAEFKKLGVEQLRYFVYDKGKKQGDGARALGSLWKDPKVKGIEFKEFEGTQAQLAGKAAENILGYQITPKELYEAYVDNEVVADDDFKGKPIFFTIKVPQVSKDAFGKPYIIIPTDEHGFSGLHIYIESDDPFLRRIKKGSQIIMRAYPKGLVLQDVILDGVIISDGTAFLVDGKAVPAEDIKKK